MPMMTTSLNDCLTPYVRAAAKAGKSVLTCPVCGRGEIRAENVHLDPPTMQMTLIYVNQNSRMLGCNVCWCPVTPEWWK